MNTLQDLIDRQDIAEVRRRFGRALDDRDWDLFASVFTDEVDADLPAFGLSGTTARASIVSSFQHVFRRPVREMGTQQLYGNVSIEVDGDEATSRSYLLGHHHIAGFAGGEDVELRAVYLDALVRTGDGWKIHRTALQVQSLTGNPAIFA